MRARMLLTGITLGATILVGGAATAQAAPAAPSRTNTAVAAAGHWQNMGTYSESACYDLVSSYAGPAYCTSVFGGYALIVWVA
jgi:hypothetical protein